MATVLARRFLGQINPLRVVGKVLTMAEQGGMGRFLEGRAKDALAIYKRETQLEGLFDSKPLPHLDPSKAFARGSMMDLALGEGGIGWSRAPKGENVAVGFVAGDLVAIVVEKGDKIPKGVTILPAEVFMRAMSDAALKDYPRAAALYRSAVELREEDKTQVRRVSEQALEGVIELARPGKVEWDGMASAVRQADILMRACVLNELICQGSSVSADVSPLVREFMSQFPGESLSEYMDRASGSSSYPVKGCGRVVKIIDDIIKESTPDPAPGSTPTGPS